MNDNIYIGEQYSMIDYKNYIIFPREGKIYSSKTNRHIGHKNPKGYWDCSIRKNSGEVWRTKVHRIIYTSINGEIKGDLQVNHIDENKDNNSIYNLNLMTPKENTNYGTGIARRVEKQTNGKCSKQIGAYKDGVLQMVFPSTREAQRQGFSSGAICNCCNGKSKQHKGFQWRYTDNKPKLFI